MLKGLFLAAVFFLVWFAILGLIMAEPNLPIRKKILYGLGLLKNYIFFAIAASAAAFVLVMFFGNFHPY